MQTSIIFDGCTIEWDVSAHGMPFLDMLVYIDRDGSVQWQPYRKAKSHLERIPFVSHHPIDVKKGTFVGEMSRLATLCSKWQSYKDAMTDLINLYIVRGYPEALVKSWYKQNVAKRWSSRLLTKERVHEELIVLKSEFNPAWNYFNASELKRTIFTYWHDALESLASGRKISKDRKLLFVDQDETVLTDVGFGTTWTGIVGGREVVLPDVRKLDMYQSRMLVSRKRTTNLFDLSNLWKNIVLNKLDARATQEAWTPGLEPQVLGKHAMSDTTVDNGEPSTSRTQPPVVPGPTPRELMMRTPSPIDEMVLDTGDVIENYYAMASRKGKGRLMQ